MSADTETAEATSTPAPRAGKGVLIAAILAGSLGGSAAGAFAVAPLFAPSPASAATEVVVEDAAHEGESASAATPPVVLNNLVLNPADSRGTRFLLVSVGLQLAPTLTPEAFEKRETEVRDRVLQVLATKTIDELVDVTRRNGFRTELAVALDSLLGANQVRGVFFPQFVIQ